MVTSDRVVTRCVGSGIKGAGSGIRTPGSGITAVGSGIRTQKLGSKQFLKIETDNSMVTVTSE